MSSAVEVALSISAAPDRAKLGFPPKEESRVLFTVCTQLIRHGHSILYSGDLRSGGYTLAMFKFLVGTYAGQDIEPFTSLLPEPVVRRASYSDIKDAVFAAQGVAKVELVVGGTAHFVRRQGDGLLIDPTGPERVEVDDSASLAAWLERYPLVDNMAGFTAARQVGTDRAAARISFGGKMGQLALREDLYEGALPGIAEEAVLTLQQSKPYVPLAAFGGATRDVAIALGLLDETLRVPRAKQLASYDEGMSQVAAMRDAIEPGERDRLMQLAASDRAEEIGITIVELLAERATRSGR